MLHQNYLLDEDHKVSFLIFRTAMLDALNLGQTLISQKLIISFPLKIQIKRVRNYQVADVLNSAGLEVTNFIRVEVGRSGAE